MFLLFCFILCQAISLFKIFTDSPDIMVISQQEKESEVGGDKHEVKAAS